MEPLSDVFFFQIIIILFERNFTFLYNTMKTAAGDIKVPIISFHFKCNTRIICIASAAMIKSLFNQ